MSKPVILQELPVLLVVLGLLANPVAHADTTYRWVDKSGQVHYSDQPPPADIGTVEEKNLPGASVIETGGPGYATRKAAEHFPVTLYTATDCPDECRQARDFLTRRRVPYSETVIRNSSDADTFKRATGATDVFVPSLGVGSQFQRGFLDSAWNTLLDNAGYPGGH